jgi:outer membrane murein-binding lipoprotein Lpp
LEVPVKRALILFSVCLVSILFLAACSSPSNGDESSAAVQAYLNALVNKDSSALSTLSCKDWEAQAAMELDSFQAVTTELQDLSCKKTGNEGDMDVVTCTGKINATYNNENMQIDLNKRPFLVKRQGSDWQVCGYK